MTESISFSVFTYSELHLFLFFMIAYMMVRILIAGRANHINSYKYLAISYASYGLTVIFDMLFTLMEHFEAEKPFTFKLIIILWYFFGIMGCLFWFIYTDLAEGTGFKKNTGLIAFAFLPAALNVCFILIPVLSEHYFLVSGDSNYSRGDWFLLYSVLNGFYLVIVPVLALIRIFRAKRSHQLAINYIFILFSLPISLSELLQQGTDRNFRCLGITLSLLVTYSYLNNLGEKRRTNLVEGLTMDFDEVFVVDVDEDSIISIVRDNRKGINGRRLLHLKGNSYTKNVLDTIVEAVPVDEREKVIKEFDREWIYEELKTKQAVSSIFRVKNIGDKDKYYHAKFGRLNGGGGRKFILGIRDADAETRNQMNLEAGELLKNDIIKVLSADYIGLFFFNLKDPDERINSIIPIDTNEGFTLVGNDKTVSEVFGKYLKYYVHPDDRRLIKYTIRYDNIERVLADKRRHSVTFRRKFGEDYKYVEMMIAKVEDEKKPPLNIAIGFSLVDEEYRARLSKDDELKDALLKADQASDSKTEFLFNMSHDIRTPMNAIKGFTELAIRHIDDSEKVTDYLNKIQKSEEHLLELINNILDMARVEKGQLKGDTKQINILELVDSMVDMNQADAEIKNINFITQKKNIRNAMVYADELHLSQILMNILSNAIKYTQKGSVTFTTRELKNSDKGYATYEFVVEDTGIGMSGEFLDKIFDSFSRERNSTVSGIQGPVWVWP